MDDDWRAILGDAVARTSVAEVARRMGVARTSVSLLLHDRYPGGTGNMAARVLATLVEPCPVYGGPRRAATCVTRRAAPLPTSNPFALRRWRECQACTHYKETDHD